jgi:hypothetical protein
MVKAKLLKDFTLGDTSFKKDDIIDVELPSGGERAYGKKASTNEYIIPLRINTDIALILTTDEENAKSKQKGRLMFYGALVILGFITYKLLKNK